MKKNYFNKAISALIIFLLVSIAMQSCKKDKDASDNTNNSKYYLTATVNGVNWKSDTAIAGYYQNEMMIIAIKVVNSDTSGFVFDFPDMIDINQPTAFDQNQDKVLVYAFQPNPTSTTIYEADPSVAGSGTFTVTKFDKNAKMIEGTFSGIGVNLKNSNDQITIIDGKFSLVYIIGKPSDIKI
jgi:hypothetical protein